MPKPQPMKIAVIEYHGDDGDWRTVREDLDDAAIIEWAAAYITAAEFDEADIEQSRIIIGWTTNHAIDAVNEFRGDDIPHYDDDLQESDPEDAAMLARAERLTETLRAKLRAMEQREQERATLAEQQAAARRDE